MKCRIYDCECINPAFCDSEGACCAGDPECQPPKWRLTSWFNGGIRFVADCSTCGGAGELDSDTSSRFTDYVICDACGGHGCRIWDPRPLVNAIVQVAYAAASWREGVEASLRKVRYRLSVMPDLQKPAYTAALRDVELHLMAMLERGTERSTTPIDEG